MLTGTKQALDNHTPTQGVSSKHRKSVRFDPTDLAIHDARTPKVRNPKRVAPNPPIPHTQNDGVPLDRRAFSPNGDATVYRDIGLEQDVVFAERENYVR
jgi:hypothetical protein